MGRVGPCPPVRARPLRPSRGPSSPFPGTFITLPGGLAQLPRDPSQSSAAAPIPSGRKGGTPGETKEVFRVSSCGLYASRMDKLQLRIFSQTTGSVKRKDKYCPGLQPCAAGKPSKDSQTRSYFHSKQRRGASRVQAGKGLTVKGLGKMPWDAPLAQIPLSSPHLQTGGSLRPLASDPYPPPGSPFPQKGEGRGWQQADGGKEGWSVLRASPWK